MLRRLHICSVDLVDRESSRPRRKSALAKAPLLSWPRVLMLATAFSRTTIVNLRIRTWCRVSCSHRKMALTATAAKNAEEPKLKIYNSLTKSKVDSAAFLSRDGSIDRAGYRSNLSHRMVAMSSGTTVVRPSTIHLTWGTPGKISPASSSSLILSDSTETMLHRISLGV